jgi:hypothetical protein
LSDEALLFDMVNALGNANDVLFIAHVRVWVSSQKSTGPDIQRGINNFIN